MKHDSSLARQTQPARPGLIGRIATTLGLTGREADVTPEPDTSGPASGVDALGAILAELIATAQSQVNGAVALVGQSADEANAYRRTLDAGAQAIGTSVPSELADALVLATRTMIERATTAEERLRGMSKELDALRADLDDARVAAERDALTGLPNRRAMEKALAAAIATARATNAALSLAFCDIDHFKKVNDRQGHALGDRVLRLVGDTLADGAGDKAFVSRHGGDEFMMLFDGLHAEQAAVEVDAIRARLVKRELRSRTNSEPIGTISLSAGVAMLAPDEALEDLCRRADRALYRAKDMGRNRVEIDREDD